MTKFVILGSCRFEPYDFIAVPNKIPGAWNTDKGYIVASKIFHPAMKKANVIVIYAPDGIGKHTQLDIDYARSIGKKVFIMIELTTKIICEKHEELKIIGKKGKIYCESCLADRQKRRKKDE